MKQPTAYLLSLLASTARALPNIARADDDINAGQSLPLDLSSHNSSTPERFRFISSNNWAGALVPAPDGESFVSASGTFNVPDVSQPDGDAGLHGAAAWVGIDGAQNKAAILQAGCKFVSTTAYGNQYSCW